MSELIGLSISPYTEKARWALDHQQVSYRYSEHLIIFGMPSLRWKTKTFFKELTVPVFIDDQIKLLDSFDIAQHADRTGNQEPIFRNADLSQLKYFNELSEQGLDAGRALAVPKLLNDPKAKFENLPSFLAHPIFVPLASFGLRYIIHEFAISSETQKNEDHLRQVLLTLREKLKASNGQYLLGYFSYADICMAAVLQFVDPVLDTYIPLKPATRNCWTNIKIAAEFRDLLKWRDALYLRHRRMSAQ